MVQGKAWNKAGRDFVRRYTLETFSDKNCDAAVDLQYWRREMFRTGFELGRSLANDRRYPSTWTRPSKKVQEGRRKKERKLCCKVSTVLNNSAKPSQPEVVRNCSFIEIPEQFHSLILRFLTVDVKLHI